MIVFVHRAEYIRVIRLSSSAKPTDNLGKLIRTSRRGWIWDVDGVEYFRSWIGYETLNGSEKRQLIGLLDNLNGIPYRAQEDMRTQWEKITGLKHATL